MSRVAARAKSAPVSPMIVGPSSRNVVADTFDRFGELEPLVTRRLSTSKKLGGLAELRAVEADRQRAVRRLQALPCAGSLRADLNALSAAVYEAAEETTLRFLVATLIEAIPAAGAQMTEVYIDGLVWSLAHVDDDRDPDDTPRYRGFSGNVLAAAVRKLWQTCRFAPSIEETIKAACAARSRYFEALAVTNRLMRLHSNAVGVIAQLDYDPEADPDAIPF